MKYDDNVECCANCKWLEQTPRNNRYGDTDNFCMYLGYYCTGIYKDRNKVRHFTPGGRELHQLSVSAGIVNNILETINLFPSHLNDLHVFHTKGKKGDL